MARVLVIEDDKFSREFIRDVLEKSSASMKYQSKWPLKVTTCENAVEALELMKNGFSFELIITDIMMARLSGYEFIKEIRKTKSQSELPIIVVSAIDGTELEYQSLRVGASAWFTKPLRIKEFVQTVFNLVGGV